jgi:LacI family repressor for deo operon, udp, cdd, tsx, nupC, and nupG
MSTPATRRRRGATIEDVAVQAGVSVATVSRALRGLPNVASSTRERVMTVADELNYQPDPAATRLAAGRTRTVTVAVPTLNGWYFSTVVAGAEAVCTEAGYDILVIGIGSVADRARLLRDDSSLERRTDGLVVVDLNVTEDEAASLRARGIILATVGSTAPGFPSVKVDDHGVGRLATEHLIGLGHHRIGVLGGLKHDPMSFDVPAARQRGHEAAMRAAGLTVEPALTTPGNFSIDGGQEAMARLLALHEPPTAVFAMSDEMAFGALRELRERELAVPGDMSVIGVDDHEFARVVDLTTVRQRVAAHGATAARLVIEAIDAAATEEHQGRPSLVVATDHDAIRRATEVELVVRRTTGPPRRSGT